MSTYDETVYAAWWFLPAVAIATAAAVVSAMGALFGDDDERWGAVAALVGVGVTLGVVEFVFMRLRIELRGGSLRFRFGPFGPTLRVHDIVSAAPAPYRCLAFGGWGIRFGRIDGRSARAYSVPFLRTGVSVETASGRLYYTSSRRPGALAEAIGAAKGMREGQG